MLQIHCLARTRLTQNYHITVKSTGEPLRAAEIAGINIAMEAWATALSDPLIHRAMFVQLKARLQDEFIIDGDIYHLLYATLHFFALTPLQLTYLDTWALLRGVVRALERQKCMGTIHGGVEYKNTVYIGIILLE